MSAPAKPVMTASPEPASAPPTTGPPRSALTRLPGLLLMALITYAFLGALFFGLAGRVDLPWIWATLGTFVATHLPLVIVLRKDPGLIQERMKPGPGVPLWDRFVLGAAGILMVGTLIFAPLDVGRLHWSDSVPVAAKVGGLILLAIGMAIMGWAMAVNTFFSKVVRIQRERGHRVISDGPYRFVRHPGYVGWTLLWTGLILGLGSWIAVALSVAGHVVIVVRAAKEDRFLHDELEGYVAYSERVRWRLLPGVW